MSIVVLAAAAAVGAALAILSWLLLTTRGSSREIAVNLRGGPQPGHGPGSAHAPSRTHTPTLQPLARHIRASMPVSAIGRIENRLAAAGRHGVTADHHIAGKALGLVIGVVAGGVWWSLGPSVSRTLLWLAAAALGYWGPDLRLLNAAQAHTQGVERALPDTLDQMSIAVQAGLAFDAAMLRVSRSNDGPLARELAVVQHEIRLGVPRAEALRRMGSRTGCADLRRFVNAVVQSDAYGIPIADILDVQAGQLRQKRSQRAEERAMKVPVKIIFPLILCVLPSLFTVLVGPAVIRIMRDLF